MSTISGTHRPCLSRAVLSRRFRPRPPGARLQMSSSSTRHGAFPLHEGWPAEALQQIDNTPTTRTAILCWERPGERQYV